MGRPKSLGDYFGPPSISDYNAWLELAAWWRTRRPSGVGTERETIPTDLVMLKNTTGGQLAAGRIMEIGEPLITTITRENVWFDGDVYGSGGLQGFAVALRTMPIDAIDWCQSSGTCLARVNLTDVDHRFAEPADGESVLQSAASGRCEILWLETGSVEEQDALIRIGAGGSSTDTFFGKMDASITNGSTGTMSIWADGADTTDNMTVRNRTTQTLLTGILMRATRGSGATEYLVEPYELEACP